MELPTFLPASYRVLESLSEEEAKEKLSQDTRSLTTFFESAARDTIWRSKFSQFFDFICQTATELYAEGHLSTDLALRIKNTVYSMQEEYSVKMPKDLKLQADDQTFEVNSLLLSLASPFFNNLITLSEGQNIIKLPNGKLDFFQIAIEYVEKGEMQDLWKMDRDRLLWLLNEANFYQVDGIIQKASETFRKYLSHANAVNIANLSYERNWDLLYAIAIETLNTFDIGAYFTVLPSNSLKVEFHDFREQALDDFLKLKNHVSFVAFHENLDEDSRFSDIVKKLSHLKGLDISNSRAFSDRLLDVSQDLEELNLSMCSWLDKENFSILITHFYRLKKLNLSSNRQLNYQLLGHLRKLGSLESLNLSRCHQLTDDEFKIAIQSLPSLNELGIEDTSKLSDSGLNLIGKLLPKLQTLNLSKTTLSDQVLIELSGRLTQLKVLHLRRVPNISDLGIIEVIKKIPFLKQLDLTNSPVSERALLQIKQMRPHLKVVNQ